MGWARLAAAVAARGILFSILGMLTWALLPTALGWTPTTVMTGSMEPRIHPGDVVVSRPATADAAALNRILLVDDPDHAGRLRLHRFAEFAPDGNLILRGDANSANDSTPVAPAAVHGVAVLRIPFVGLPMVWFAEKNWGPLAAVLAAVTGLTLAAASGSTPPSRPSRPGPLSADARVKRREQQHRPYASAPRRRGRLSAHGAQAVQTVLAVAAIPVLVGAALMTASPAHAAFSAVAPTPTSNFSALASYPCLSPAMSDNPYLFYPFNEGSGALVADASANATPHNGTLYGTTTRIPGSCTRNASPALGLNGSTGYVSTASSVPAPNVFTVEIWFKTTTGTGGKLIGFGNRQTGLSTIADRHLYMTNSGAIVFGVPVANGDNDVAAVTSPRTYRDGQWHLATATLSASVMTLYIDGTQVASQGGLQTSAGYRGYWRIGFDTIGADWPSPPTSRFFAGTVDNAAVYPTALSLSRVQAHYAAGH